MIIAYYPGAGGNRYLRMLQGLEWQKMHQGYDSMVHDQSAAHRYFYHNSEFNDLSAVTLTHCLNTPLIKKVCPDRSITVIIGDVQPCFRREWLLYGHERYHKKITPIIDDLELYGAVKDPSWPLITSMDEFNTLPLHMQQEFHAFRANQMKQFSTTTDPLALLQKEFHDRVESAYEILKWHLDYYKQHPLDLSQCDTIIDINGKSEFAKVMKIELARYSSEIFDRCWQQLT